MYEIAIARDVTPSHGTLAHLRGLLALAWAGTSIASALILLVVTRRSLRPLHDLRRQIGDVDEGALDRTFELPDATTELEPIVEQLNALVGRLGQAFEREQAFSSHAAHELRTPLAGLRAMLELSLSRDRSTEERAELEQRCLDVVGEMQTVVETLLEIARTGSGTDVRRESVRVVELVRDACERFGGAASERGLDVAIEIGGELLADTDPVLARRVLDNLIENAVAYADEESQIHVSATANGESLRIVVDNAASDAPDEVAERAAEPFWRADASRSATGTHAGLGLSLCHRVVEVLDGTLELELDEGRFAATLALPKRS